ncbi:hypothetical protein CC80DRAFT_472857 [Byssothecium circinans]|uniref:F-box domain-containing protein n=1 Tax=Byssothecium circinans TaxID=147558 RepID=A0A6A5U4W9_9PLEO|nr:hypothetical protein CC80DRAFT_472857 [Byssothecium circinans]
MDHDTPSSSSAFNKLPIELNKTIVHFVGTDRDIANFRRICRATNHAVDGDHLSFWRAAYREKYVLLPGRSNKELKYQYQRRSKYLRRGTSYDFVRGHGGIEKRILGILKDLINESFKGTAVFDEQGRPQCLNQLVIQKFVMDSRLLLNSKRPKAPKSNEPNYVSPSLAAVKLMCSQFLFNPDADIPHGVVAIEESQQAVYAPTNLAPIFVGPKKNEVNMEWVLHCLNFFRYYMMNPDASALYDNLAEEALSQRPTPWEGPLKSGSYPLGNCWKGTYAYLDHKTLDKLRERSANPSSKKAHDGEFMFEDLNIDEGKIQSLHLNFVDEESLNWPDDVEAKVHSKRETIIPTTRAQHSKKSSTDDIATKNIGIKGWGEDLQDHFYATGFLNPLPDQCDILGWQRITLMKHFEEDLSDHDGDNLWAYEGVVLPGGKIILGRWYYASEDENDYSGPFILWQVEPEPELVDDSEDDNES